MTSTRLSLAFDDLTRELVALDRAWTCDHERASLRHAAGDLRHHVCAALDVLEAATTYTTLGVEARILAHEAFLSVLALGQLLLRALEDHLAHDIAIARAQCTTDAMLDLLSPFVSHTDEALRRVLLEDVTIEAALADTGERRR